MALSMYPSSPARPSQGFGKTSRYSAGAANSRSTSAGSSLSDGRSSCIAKLPFSPESPAAEKPSSVLNDLRAVGQDVLYQMDPRWPLEYDYDYASVWSSMQQSLQMLEADYLVPPDANSTVIDNSVWQTSPLESFQEEWQTWSCPSSEIGMPPGLEDLLPPEEAAANLIAAEATLRQLEIQGDQEATQALHHLPDGLLDSPLDPEAPQFLPLSLQQPAPLNSKAAEFVPPSMQQPLALDNTIEPGTASLNPKAAEFVPPSMQQPLALDNTEPCGLESQLPSYTFFQETFLDSILATHSPQEGLQSLLMDSMLATQSPQEELRPMTFNEQLASSGLPTWAENAMDALQESGLGPLEFPTAGSEDHRLGTCRPCAFMFTKGCASGVLCQFCHLCDAGERKRRSRVKRAEKRVGNQRTC